MINKAKYYDAPTLRAWAGEASLGFRVVEGDDFDALAAENERLRDQIAERDAAIEEWSGTAVQNGMEVDRLNARVAELEQDAKRWRACKKLSKAWWMDAMAEASLKYGRSLDESIDATIAIRGYE